MTTLADLTPEERAQCRGMWVTYQTPMGEHQAIYGGNSVLFEPGYGLFTIPLQRITPRLDLPRAWTPDGTPPAGEWEDDYIDTDGSALITGEDLDLDLDSHTHIRRFVGEWEEA
ncbi:hypothetical protein [Corynebacterium guaraldiae]|uniref:hypothetical protein n=1 Tax=Corynebacterium guaraldiae TaxID=3051103 RepID=UPI0011775386|nr:hypothetical protein [Corynebacterium guaraldiae]TRX42501.1 hypothetical protein FNY89_03135 [Corynebacterium guaraldiae]